MIVIRRMVDRHRAYTAIFLKGEPPKIFPTSDAEHARILQVYKQDRPHEGILNDFSEIDFPASTAAAPPPVPPAPWPLAPQPRRSAEKRPSVAKPAVKRSPRAAGKTRSEKTTLPSLWLVPAEPKP